MEMEMKDVSEDRALESGSDADSDLDQEHEHEHDAFLDDFAMVSMAMLSDEMMQAEEAAAAEMELSRVLQAQNSYSPRDIAEFLHTLPQLEPKAVGHVLGKPDALALDVLQEYANGFVFAGVPFDLALRVYLGRIMLPGEAQQIDRILQAFARAYYQSNPNDPTCPSEDAIYLLAFSVILLHTEAHHPRLARHQILTPTEFVNMHTESGIPRDFLLHCYESFVTRQIQLIHPKAPTMRKEDELELTFADGPLGLSIETAVASQTCVVRQYMRPHRHVHCSRAVLPDLTGFVIVGVGDDSTERLDYDLTRYLLLTAPRPVVLRFCEPSAYFAATAS